MKIETIALVACAIAGSASASTLLLTDDFVTSVGSGAAFNENLPTRQGGSLATVSYTVSDTDFHIYSDGAMGLNFQGSGWGGAWASLNHNFATDANNAGSPLEIQFDMWADSAPGGDAWVGFGLGSTQGDYFFNYPYGFLARQSEGLHNYKLVISDTAGTGSGFNGISNGASVEFFIDGVSQGITAHTFATDGGYITFRTIAAVWGGAGSWGIGHVDNLSVSLVPEPSAALLGGLGMLAFLRRRR